MRDEIFLEKALSPLASFEKQVNAGLCVQAFLEDDYLYHTTDFHRLQRILRDGFLSSNPDHTEHSHLHKGQICFTTNPLRHLSNFPPFTFMLGDVPMDTYIKFPVSYLIGKGARAIFYTIDSYELARLSEVAPYWLQHLTTEEHLRREYGDSFNDYRYSTWMAENEWRIKVETLPLPEMAEVYVSSYYQRTKARTLTTLPVYLWRDVMKIKDAVRESKKREVDRFRALVDEVERALTRLIKERAFYEEAYGKEEYQRILESQKEEVNYIRARAKMPILTHND